MEQNLAGKIEKNAQELQEQSSQLDKVEESLTRKIAENRTRINGIDAEAKKMEARLLQEIDRRTTGEVITNELSRDDAYLVARKSLRLWPMREANKHSLDTYLTSYLAIAQSEIDDLGEVVISRTKNPGRGVTDECLVRFSTIQDRDFVQSKAPKLARSTGKAGMRLEIPDHIHWVFKLLEKESWSISKRWPGAKRNIRFDDATRSFFLDVKVVDGQWERIYPAQVQKAMTARKEEGPSGGVSAILGVKPEVLLDGGQQ